MTAVSTVVGHKNQPVGCCLELVLQNNKILVAEADDYIDLGTGLLEGHGCRQSNGAANAAADHADPLLALHIGVATEQIPEGAHVHVHNVESMKEDRRGME